MAMKKATARKFGSRKSATKRSHAKKAARKAEGGGTFYERAIPRTSSSKPPVKVKAKATVKQTVRPKKLSAPKPKTAPPQTKKDGRDTHTPDLVFVGMSFRGDGMEDVFAAIKDGCATLGLKAKRVDENTTSGFIVLEIVDLIEKAEFIIFDLTFERPNVYYELGYAHGVGNAPSNILLLAKEGTQLHFDIAQLRVRFYKSTENLRQIVKDNLNGMVAATRMQ